MKYIYTRNETPFSTCKRVLDGGTASEVQVFRQKDNSKVRRWLKRHKP